MVSLFLSLLALGSTPIWGLQVTPNSPCASVCMNDPTKDPSDPNSSNTLVSEIVCHDDDYTSNPVGQKFETCLNCLQNSSAVSGDESDQAWFIYNLRFAFDTCVFGANNDTNITPSPCSLAGACGPLQEALLDGMSNPETLQEYSYCGADGNSFLGSNLPICSKCLAETANEFFFSNFLTALDAGCVQQTQAGDLIGLNGTVFTTDAVQITSPVIPVSHSHKVLTTAGIIGISIAGFVLILCLSAILFISTRKRLNSRRLKRMKSPLDSRFGALNITAPTRGAYASPKHSPPLTENGSHPMKRTPRPLNFARNSWGRPRLDNMNEKGDRTLLTTISPPKYSPYSEPDSSQSPILPKHAAYIPHEYTPPSRNSFPPDVHLSINNAPSDSSVSSLSAPYRHSAQAQQARNAGVTDILPPPPSYPQRPMSTIPSASLIETHAESIEVSVVHNPSNASLLNRFPNRDPNIGTVGRTRDASASSIRRARDTSVGSTRRVRDGSIGRIRDASIGRIRDSVGRRQARDTSVGSIGRRARDGSLERSTTPISISGPMVNIGGRMSALQVRGLGGAIAHDPNSKEIESPESTQSLRSEPELWPGTY